MKTQLKTKKETGALKFSNLPRAYRELCLEIYLPQRIHGKGEYRAAERVADVMAGFESEMSEDQKDYFDAITDYMEAYDSVSLPALSGMELLKHLMEANELNGTELAGILGVDRTLANKILNGSRRLTIPHAQALAKRFRLEVGAFIAA